MAGELVGRRSPAAEEARNTVLTLMLAFGTPVYIEELTRRQIELVEPLRALEGTPDLDEAVRLLAERLSLILDAAMLIAWVGLRGDREAAEADAGEDELAPAAWLRRLELAIEDMLADENAEPPA